MNSGSIPARFLKTALAFAIFGSGALLFSCLVFPLLRLLPCGKAKRTALARKFIHQACRLFTRIMTGLGLIELQVENRELLRENAPYLLVANHPTLFDVVLLFSLFGPGRKTTLILLRAAPGVLPRGSRC